VESTGFLGIAYLAVRSLRGLPVTFPGTTGAPRPLTGRVLAKP
jgi:anhydro-N-acetylmuramic acid kinase